MFIVAYDCVGLVKQVVSSCSRGQDALHRTSQGMLKVLIFGGNSRPDSYLTKHYKEWIGVEEEGES